LKEIKDDFKEKMNPLKKDNRHLLYDVKHGYSDEEIEVYLVPDFDNMIMEQYNSEGTKVGERKMLMSERQSKLPL